MSAGASVAMGATTRPRLRRNAGPALMVIEETEGWWEATGTRDQLLAAGLCFPAHFPEGRQRSAGGCESTATGPRHWVLVRRCGGVWELRVIRPEAELPAYRRAKAERERRAEERAAAEREREAGPEGWRTRLRVSTLGAFAALRSVATSGPYCTDAAGLDALSILGIRLLLWAENVAVAQATQQAVTDSAISTGGDGGMPSLARPLWLAWSSANAAGGPLRGSKVDRFRSENG